MKRKLTDQEITISLRNKERIEKELKSMKYHLKYNELMFNEGLDVNYERQKEEYKSVIKKLKQDITANTKMLNILEDQIKNGVEIKGEQ